MYPAGAGECYFSNSVSGIILVSEPSQEKAGLEIQHFNENIFSGSE